MYWVEFCLLISPSPSLTHSLAHTHVRARAARAMPSHFLFLSFYNAHGLLFAFFSDLIGARYSDRVTERKVSAAEAHEFAVDNNFLFMEMSCLDHLRVSEAVSTLVAAMLDVDRKVSMLPLQLVGWMQTLPATDYLKNYYLEYHPSVFLLT